MSDITPWEVNISQVFQRETHAINRLDEYVDLLESKKPLPTGHRIIQATDEHRIIRAGRIIIEMLERRCHTDSPRWWWSPGRKIYTHIENHCKRAGEIEKNMGVEDVREFREELERRGSTRISVMPLTADQVKQISVKFNQLLCEARSAALLFEQYREATEKSNKDKQKILKEDLENIERHVNEAVRIVDLATGLGRTSNTLGNTYISRPRQLTGLQGSQNDWKSS